MWTASNKRYYDVVRAEERRQRARVQGGKQMSATLPTGTASSAAAASAKKTDSTAWGGTTTGTSKRVAKASSAPAPSPLTDPTLTEQPNVLDPVVALNMVRTDIQHVTELVFDHRQLTGLHPNLLLFENLEMLSLQHNKFRTLHNLLPALSSEAAEKECGGHDITASRMSTMEDEENGVGGYFLSAATGASSSSGAASRRAAATWRNLAGPRGCFRLKRLLLAGNRLRRLDSAHTDIPRLTSLEYLNVSHNKLSDLEGVLRVLQPLKQLTYLDLTGNPVCEDPAYRLTVVARLPQVAVLDRVAVTSAERREVAATAVSRPTDSKLPQTLLAFGSTVTKRHGAPNDDTLATTRSAPWSKSACVKLMEKRVHAHLASKAEREAAAAHAEQEELTEALEKKQGFHAVWGLTRPGQPLSSTATSPSAAITMDAAGSSKTVSGPSSGGGGGVASTGRKRGSLGAGGSHSSAPSGSSRGPLPAIHAKAPMPTTTSSIPVAPRTLAETISGVPADACKDRDAVAHESTLFDALLGHTVLMERKGLHGSLGTTTGDTANEPPRAPVGAPAPERLRELDAAITDANHLVRLMSEQQAAVGSTKHGGGGGGSSTRASGQTATPRSSSVQRTTTHSRSVSRASQHVSSQITHVSASLVSCAAPLEEGVAHAASSSQAAAAATTQQALMESLRARAHAFIPPPWEGLRSNGGAAGEKITAASGASLQGDTATGRARAYAVAEKLDALAVAVATLFLPQELQALETRFGPCELITAARAAAAQQPHLNGGGGVFMASVALSAPGSNPNSSAGGRRSPPHAGNSTTGPAVTSGKRPSSQTSRKSVRGTAATVAAAAEAEGTRETLWAALTTTSTVAPAAAAAAAALPAVTSSLSSPGASASSAPGAGAAAGGGVPMNQCVVGPFSEASLSAFLNELQQGSGAWDLPTVPLLQGLLTAYEVDPITRKSLRHASLGTDTGNSGRKKESGSGDVGGTGGGPSGGGGGAGARSGRGHLPSSKTSSFRGRKPGADTAAAATATGASGMGSGGPGGAGGSGVTDGTVRGAGRVRPGEAPLTVNHLLAALVCYAPFLASRAAFYDKRCAEATAVALRTGAVRASRVNPMTAKAPKRLVATGAAASHAPEGIANPLENSSSSSEDDDAQDTYDKAWDSGLTHSPPAPQHQQQQQQQHMCKDDHGGNGNASAGGRESADAASPNAAAGAMGSVRPTGKSASVSRAAAPPQTLSSEEEASLDWFARTQQVKVLLSKAQASDARGGAWWSH